MTDSPTELIEQKRREIALPDGGRLLIRPVIADDKQRLKEGFERLSPESRYRRFMSVQGRLSEQNLAYLTEIDYRNHFAWAAFDLDQPDTPGVAVARYVRLARDPEVAEAAVAVLDTHQKRGIGSLLLQALGAVALENGIKRFAGYLLAENRPAAELLGRLGGAVSFDSTGMARYEIDLPAQAERLADSPVYAILKEAAKGTVDISVPSL